MDEHQSKPNELTLEEIAAVSGGDSQSVPTPAPAAVAQIAPATAPVPGPFPSN